MLSHFNASPSSSSETTTRSGERCQLCCCRRRRRCCYDKNRCCCYCQGQLVCVVFLALVVVLVVTYSRVSKFQHQLFPLRVGVTNQAHEHNIKTATTWDGRINTDTVVSCTFSQLQYAFGNDSFKKNFAMNQTTNNPIQDDKSNNKCWSLHEMILRIPATAVVNRDNLTRLGSGCQSGVYKAVIRLPHFRRNSSTYQCAVALKTDNCFHLTDNPNPSQCSHTNAISCVSSDPAAKWNYKTFMGGEYTGGLIWYAQMVTGNYQAGLMPTWGVVMDPQHPLRHWVPRGWTLSHAHPDAALVGSIMPLVPIQRYQAPNKIRDTVAFVKALIPAAKGLQFLSQMHLAMQDMVDKNIGLTQDSQGNPYFVIYDFSYSAIDPKVGQCKVPSDTNNDNPRNAVLAPCQYCHEKVFANATRSKMFVEGYDSAIGSDMARFRQIIYYFAEDKSNDPLMGEIKEALAACDSIDGLVDALQQFVQEDHDDLN